MSNPSSPMKADEVVGQRRLSFGKRKMLVVLTVGICVIVLAVSWVTQLNYEIPVVSSPYWDGGEWSGALDASMNQPAIVEFQGKLFMFYSVITENTIGGDDDVVIEPREHVLYDVLYRVFDGTNFSEPVALSSPEDKVSVQGKYFVFEERLYAVLSEWWISNYTSYETESKAHLEVFDGNNWRESQWPFVDDAYEFHDLRYFVYADKVWAVWQYMEKPVAGHSSNVFGFRTFDGKIWTETRNFTNPNTAPNDWRMTIAYDQLWYIWSKSTPYIDPNSHNPHNEVWIGRFDGANWSNVTMVSASDDTGANWGFSLTEYRDELFAFWGGEYFDTSEHGNWVWVQRSLNLIDGSLSNLTPISPESGYKCSEGSMCIYDGRVYVLWYSAYQDWKSMINTFNGTMWSSTYRFDKGYGGDGLFVYGGKLWAFGSNDNWNINQTGQTFFRSYSKAS